MGKGSWISEGEDWRGAKMDGCVKAVRLLLQKTTGLLMINPSLSFQDFFIGHLNPQGVIGITASRHLMILWGSLITKHLGRGC